MIHIRCSFWKFRVHFSLSDGPRRSRDKLICVVSLSPPPSAFSSLSEILNHSTMFISNQVVVCCTGCPVHCRVFGIISSRHPLGANSNPYPPGCTNQKCLQPPNVPPGRGLGGQNQPQWRSTHLDDIAWLSEYLYELERKGSYFEFLCVSQVWMDETGNQ